MSSSPSSGEMLRISGERRGDAVVIRLAGSANMDVSDDLRDRLLEMIADASGAVVLDLAELAFVSSVGLGAIVGLQARCRDGNRPLLIVAPQPPIRNLLEVTQLTKLIPICDTVEAALQAS